MRISYPIELKTASRRADRSYGFRCESMQQISAKEAGEIDECLGGMGLLILTDQVEATLSGKEIDDIIANMPDRDTIEKRTLSQELRTALWKRLNNQLGRKPSTEEFAKYYKAKMTALIKEVRDSV